jgi:hypothetical protein
MPMVPSEFRRRLLMKIGATSAALLLPWPSRYANAAQVQSGSGSSWQLPGTWVPSTQIQFIPNLGTWLSAHPKVRDAIVWENTSGTMIPYTSWGRSQSALNDAYLNAFRGVATGLPKVPANIVPPPNNNTVISSSDAWSLYLAHVAHSLAVELRGDLPWSIASMTDNELKILFDSRQFFAWRSDFGGYEFNGKFGGGFSTLAPPDFVYGFLQANTIPNHDKLAAGQTNSSVLYDAKSKAIARLMSWCGDKMSHFQNWTDSANLYAHWQYYGCPPVARVIEGTINASFSPTLRHWTAGCFGTTAFLRAVARTMNIAIEVRYLPPYGHTTPYVPALDAWLSHADELYDSVGAFSDQVVGTALSFPKTLLFINTATHDAWFGPMLTDAQKNANVGRRLKEVAVAYVPLGLLISYIYDQQMNFSHAAGTVASSLSGVYTVAQLEAMNLWQKMDGKIVVLGGAAVVSAINDEAQLEKES